MNVREIIRYPEARALEDAAYGKFTTPTRLFPLLLPVWCVEVSATVTTGEPYYLIDRFVERALVEGGLDSAVDLARFFSLDETLVDRVLRFLARIGHLATDPGGPARPHPARARLRP